MVHVGVVFLLNFTILAIPSCKLSLNSPSTTKIAGVSETKYIRCIGPDITVAQELSQEMAIDVKTTRGNDLILPLVLVLGDCHLEREAVQAKRRGSLESLEVAQQEEC